VLEHDEGFARGVALHDAGAYWDAHECWETLWRSERDEARRRVIQGFIQITAACHKLVVMRRAAPAARLLARGLEKLAPLDDGREGPVLRAFVVQARQLRDWLLRGEAAEELERAPLPKFGSSSAAP
jgi:uncharacterized protein